MKNLDNKKLPKPKPLTVPGNRNKYSDNYAESQKQKNKPRTNRFPVSLGTIILGTAIAISTIGITNIAMEAYHSWQNRQTYEQTYSK